MKEQTIGYYHSSVAATLVNLGRHSGRKKEFRSAAAYLKVGVYLHRFALCSLYVFFVSESHERNRRN